MPVITLTSDLGLKDHYVPALKGSIVSQSPQACIIDLSHLVQPYNILEAAFIVRNTFVSYPAGTIHVLHVNVADSKESRFILAKYKDQLFIACDNGLFPLLFDGLEEVKYYEIPRDENISNIGRAYSKAISIYIGQLIETNAAPKDWKQVYELDQRTALKPVIYPDLIRGSVFYIDHFNNAISNIRKETFLETSKDRGFEIIFNRNTIGNVCDNYADVPEGEKLCLFNSTGFLEIAINKGKASSLLGLDIGSNILIEFS